ncbi:piggyBac transposable element-derived protein 4 [Trichonephila clavipes]|nr:piggyBac transposable element-derived protein 4 [Trichonephila clavipes]
MELIEKIVSENHHGKFSATSGRLSISPSPLRLTTGHFPDVIPTTEKYIKYSETVYSSNKRDSRGKPVKETRYRCIECQVSLFAVSCVCLKTIIQRLIFNFFPFAREISG